MTGVTAMVAAEAPHVVYGAGYDVVLLLHIACVLVGLVTVVVAGTQASKLAAGLPRMPGEQVRRYFEPRVNWAGRVLYGIPVFGFALLALSRGAFALAQGWVEGGLTVWVLVAVGAEAFLWPAERRIGVLLADPAATEIERALLAGAGDAGQAADAGDVADPSFPEDGGRHLLGGTALVEIRRAARTANWVAGALTVAIVIGTVLMVAQP